MAATDILSHGERVRRIKAAIDDLRQSLVACGISQKAYGRLAAMENYIEFDAAWDEVKTGLDIASSYATAASEKIGTLLSPNTGFVFAYQWVVGKAGIDSLNFSNTNEISVSNAVTVSEGAFGDSAGVIVAVGDKIRVSGTTSNNSIYDVDSGSDQNKIVITGTITSETCITPGASVTLIRRGS